MPIFVENPWSNPPAYEVIGADGAIIESYPIEKGPKRAIEKCAELQGCEPLPDPPDLDD